MVTTLYDSKVTEFLYYCTVRYLRYSTLSVLFPVVYGYMYGNRVKNGLVVLSEKKSSVRPDERWETTEMTRMHSQNSTPTHTIYGAQTSHETSSFVFNALYRHGRPIYTTH